MRVLYLINYAGKAGTEKYVENLVRILSGGLISPYFAYNIAGELSEKMEKAGVPALRLCMGKSSVLSAAKKLADYCRENKIDVIHSQFPRENIIALLSKRHYPAPRVVMTNHLTLRLSGVSGLVWRRLNRYFSPKNHRIIAVCSEGRDIMIENGVDAGKIEVIFNGIEPSDSLLAPAGKRQELGLADEHFVFSILARFAPEKGLSFLLQVLSELRRRTEKPFCCLICGEGELFPEISEKKSALGLEDCCKLLGFRKDVRDILLTSDAYVCSSSHNEAMSFAILEAMDCALPLVVTDVGGNVDLAETWLRCGYVVPYGDIGGFAEKLLLLIENEDIRNELSNAAREKIEKYFDLNRLAHDVYKAYN